MSANPQPSSDKPVLSYVGQSKYLDDVAPETCLRIMDEAMVGWLRTLTFRGQPAKVKASWDSRAHAEVVDLHDNVNLGAKQTIPLPMLTLTAQSLSPDPSRWVRTDWRRMSVGPRDETTLYAKNDKSAVYILPFPLPVNLTYQVDIAAKTKQDMRLLCGALLMRYRISPNEIFLTAKFPEPYGEKLLPLVLERDDDTSELESGEKDRQLRHTISFLMKGWMFRVPLVVPTIRKAHVVMIDGDPDDKALTDWYGDISHYSFNGDYSQLLAVTEDPAYVPPNRVLLTVSFASDGTITHEGP